MAEAAGGWLDKFRHYLYFPRRGTASKAVRELERAGYVVQQRLGADGVNWLVLAMRPQIITKEDIPATSDALRQLATRLGGEYDGWEVGDTVPSSE
jgi:hypothetical protein